MYNYIVINSFANEILSLVLALAMSLSLVPSVATATDNVIYEENFDKVEYEGLVGTNLMTALGIDAFQLMPLLTELYSMAEQAGRSSVKISGISSLYNLFGEAAANKFMAVSQDSEAFLSVVTEKEDKTRVLFGNELGIPELQDKVIVLKSYNHNNGFCGKIGVIGSNRMSYEQIIPSIEYIASKLSKLMTEAKLDMED